MKQALKIIMLTLSLALSMSSAAQERLVVFTDPHLLSPALVVNPGQPYYDDLEANNKMTDQSAPVMQALVDTLLALKPAAVLVTGDLTKNGERKSHQDMAVFLSQLRAAGIGVYVIPGNHDVNNDNAVGYYGSTIRTVTTPTSSEFATIYADMGYGQALERDNNSLSYLFEPIDGLWVIAVDDNLCVQRDADRTINATGISLSTRNWIFQKADQGHSQGKQVILMMHHQLLEHFDDQDRLVGDAAVKGADELRQQFIAHGIRLVLTGHMHVGNITTEFNAARTDSLVEITTGSTITYPCQFRVIDVSPDRGTFSVATGNIEHVEGISKFQEYALQRYKDSTRPTVRSLVYHSWDDLMALVDQYSSYIGSVQFTQEQATDAIHNAFKDEIERIMVAMAEGNEPTRDVQGVRNSLFSKVSTLVDQLLPNTSFLVKLAIVPLIRSRLEDLLGPALDSVLADCNHYGTNQAHVTDDLSPMLRFSPIEVHVRGDVNQDGMVDIADVNAVINIILGKAVSTPSADLSGDGLVDIADVNAVINLILNCD